MTTFSLTIKQENVLIERNGKELPISADIVGKKMQLENNKNVKLLGPDPLIIEIIDKDH